MFKNRREGREVKGSYGRRKYGEMCIYRLKNCCICGGRFLRRFLREKNLRGSLVVCVNFIVIDGVIEFVWTTGDDERLILAD